MNEVQDPYEKLADTLDKIPNSFPKTDDGTHLKILRWIFDPEEAELAANLKLKWETPAQIATRIGLKPEKVPEIAERLEIMRGKGQISATTHNGVRIFRLLQFVVGIYEEQLDRLDEEFSRLMDEYFAKTRFTGLFDTEPPIFKVIPVNKVITSNTELEVYPFRTAEQMIREAKSWGVRECICKVQKGKVGDECSYPTSVCLVFAPIPGYFQDGGITRKISMEESLQHLKKAEDAGLVHCSMNIEKGHNYICNCCTCCCGVLRGLTEFKQPLAFVNADYYMSVDEDNCIACEDCVDRCQFDAISVDEYCEIDQDHCVGCGVCALACPEAALLLVPRRSEDQVRSPKNSNEWTEIKAKSRNIDLSELQ